MNIDRSRYRLSMAIAERHRAGESVETLALEYDFNGSPEHNAWIVELIIAAEETGYERGLQAARHNEGESLRCSSPVSQDKYSFAARRLRALAQRLKEQ